MAIGFGAGFTWVFPPGASDRVSTEERQARQDRFARLDPIQLEPIDSAERMAATEEMQLPSFDRAGLRSILADGDRQATGPSVVTSTSQAQAPAVASVPVSQPLMLTRVTLWDTHAQDGDVIAIMSADYRREVRITNAQQHVVIPVRQGMSVIEVIGIHDGGGGITLGVEAPGGKVLMPIMAVGQTLALPVKM